MSKLTGNDLLDAIVKQLKRTPMNRLQLMEHFNKGKTCIIVSLKKLKEQKRIHIYEYQMDFHRKTPIYGCGNFKDAVYEKPCDSERQRLYREKVKARKYQAITQRVKNKTINHHELIKWVFKCQSSNIMN
jgi:protein tyrosine phosphatase